MKYEIINGKKISTVFNDAGTKKLVVFCHGFRGSKLGPSRLFVDLAKKLEKENICSLRFDQYGSGDSAGEHVESLFNDWVKTTIKIIEIYIAKGYEVSIVGNSVGGSCVLAVASKMGNKIKSAVAWVPDPEIEMAEMKGEFCEENGHIVKWDFWKELYEAKISELFAKIVCPTYVIFASEDARVSKENQDALSEQSNDFKTVEIIEGLSHGPWTHKQGLEILDKTSLFIKNNF